MSGLRVLVTSGRFPPSVGLIAALHRAGARVDVVDSYPLAAALHAHATAKRHVLAGPGDDPLRYVEAIAAIVRARGIDLVTPPFECGYYLARYRDVIPAPIFAPPFPVLEELHNKARFVALCGDLGLPTPPTRVASDREALRAATAAFESFVARPAFSRGGHTYLTNHGPRAGEIAVDACSPTQENPWLVQAYIDGRDACTFSVVRGGRVVVHCTYEPTIPTPGGWSMQFASIEDFGTLEIVSQVAKRLDYDGFLSFDFRRTADGYVMIECNPRVSAGIFLVPPEWVGDAVIGDARELRVAEAGHRRQYDARLLNPHLVRVPTAKLVHALLTTPDAYMAEHELLPALLSFLETRHWTRVASREHRDLASVFGAGMAWDGEPMPPVLPAEPANAP